MDQIRNKAFIKTDGTVTCCGYNTSNIALIIRKEEGKDDKTGYRAAATHIICPKCGKELFKVSRNKRAGVGFTDYKGCMVKSWKPHVDFATHSSWYFEGKHGNVYRKTNLEALIYNYQTGMLYHLTKSQFPNKIKRITCFNNVYNYVKDHKQFITNCIKMRAKELLPDVDLIATLCQYFNITDDGTVENFVDKVIVHGDVRTSQIASYMMFNIMRQPKVAWLPMSDYGRISKLPKKFLNSKNRAEAIKAVFNGIGKTLRMFLLDYTDTTKYNTFDSSSSFVDNFRIITKLFNHDNLQTFFGKTGWNQSVLFGSASFAEMRPFNNLTKKNSAHIYEFIKRVGEQRLLNTMAKHFNKVGNQQGKYVMSLLADTLRSWRGIFEVDPYFDIKRQNSLQKLHDYLAKERRKVIHPNKEVEYTELELKKYNVITSWYEFRLAINTHELIDVGNDMDMCVGSYNIGLVQRNLNIITIYDDNKPIVCMEMSGDFKTIHQAKMYQNGRVSQNGELQRLVMGYCKKRGIKYDNCYDVTGVFGNYDIPAPRHPLAHLARPNDGLIVEEIVAVPMPVAMPYPF